MLSQKTIDVVKSTVPALEARGTDITTWFYKKLFEDYPELLNIFNQTNQKKGRQQTALANTVLAAAKYIDNLEAILPVVKQIAQKHRSLMIKPEHYPIVGEYLLKAIKEVLGDAATDEILTAWGEAYGAIADVFISVEKGMYEEASSQKGGWNDFKDFIIADKVKESDVITSFYIKPADGEVLPDFEPGQYITVRLKVPGEQYLVNRQYSLSQAPGKDTFRISVKREANPDTPQGKASNYLHDQINAGDRIELTAPAGSFTLNMDKQTPVVFLAGGVGITPLMSIAQAVAEKQPERPVTFVQAARNQAVQAFKDDLLKLDEKLADYKLSFVYSDPAEEKNGYVDAVLLKELKADAAEDYYICGPVPFLRGMLAALSEFNVPEEKIHFEFFGPSIQL